MSQDHQYIGAPHGLMSYMDEFMKMDMSDNHYKIISECLMNIHKTINMDLFFRVELSVVHSFTTDPCECGNYETHIKSYNSKRVLYLKADYVEVPRSGSNYQICHTIRVGEIPVCDDGPTWEVGDMIEGNIDDGHKMIGIITSIKKI
jgi:hypothetical protein